MAEDSKKLEQERDHESNVVAQKPEPKQHEFHIQIDRVHYTVIQPVMTGLELRQVPEVPIPADRDLFEVVPGGTDRKIADDEGVEIRDGKRFFTAPAQINPGSV